MAWMNMLYKTYENNVHMMGELDGKKALLTPVAHIILNMQLEITIDENGFFQSARELEKDEGKTLAPATEKSQSRSSGVVAQPLFDTLSYIARDFSAFARTAKEQKKADEKFTAYISGLRNWAESEYAHPKVAAIYKYLDKGNVISDLIGAGIVKTDDTGRMNSDKIKGASYDKAFVRFRVLSEDTSQSFNAWEDKTLWDSFISYYLSSQDGARDICYVKGEEGTICSIHPKGIVAACYGAKLISSNDASGFTYRGRFYTGDEACTVSYEATQKAHSALTWLAANQGKVIGSTDKRTFICWSPQGKPVPNCFDFDDDDDDNEEAIAYTKAEFTEKLNKYIMGYSNEFDTADDIIMMSLDAATTGRLSITYYNELKASQFLQRIENWRKSCFWTYTHFDEEKKPHTVVQNPVTYRIAEYAFGDQGGKGYIEVNDKVKREQTQRILHCILDQQPVPRDIIHALSIKASNPLVYSRGNYERVLSTACALTAKYYNDKKKGAEFTMTLDTTLKDRNYVFGRLLAIADTIERQAMRTKFAKTGDSSDRPTAAQRYMSAFANHPMYVYKIIRTELRPYLKMLSAYQNEKYSALLDEVFDLVDTSEIKNLNKPLNEIYLLGYSHQRRALLNKNDENDKSEEE